MKRVWIYLSSVVILLVISIISLGLLDFYEITLTIIPKQAPVTIFLLIAGISLGIPLGIILILLIVKYVRGLFKPKFLRIADNLEYKIQRGQNISYRLSIPLKREHVIDKMDTIWSNAEMQYPLSELDFEKLKGGKKNA